MKQENLLPEEAITNIIDILGCKREDIRDIERMKIGLTNASYAFTASGIKYVYRAPGEGTELFINRECEAYAEEAALALGLDSTLIHIDSHKGWKLSRFVPGAEVIDPADLSDRRRAMELLKKLHEAKVPCKWVFDYVEEATKLIGILEERKMYDTSLLTEIHEKICELGGYMEQEGAERILCHNDAWSWNMLKGAAGELVLIDWEYAGASYPQSDVAYFTSNYECSHEEYLALAELYEGRSLTSSEKRFYLANLAAVMWYWYVWALFEEASGTEVSDKELWYRKAEAALTETLAAYKEGRD